MKKTLFLIILAMIPAAVFLSIPRGEKKILEIRPGATAVEVARLLREEGIIKKQGMFLSFIRLAGSAKKIKAGIYSFRTSENYLSIMRKLVRGSGIYIKVTIPEGFTTEQVAERLLEYGVITDSAAFVKKVLDNNLRGYLFPETYYFAPNGSMDGIIHSMTDEFYKVFDDTYKKRAEELGFTVDQAVTLASLVEKEAKVPSERPVISAIFHRRLKTRKYLESCASVQFALGKHKERLRYKDLEVDSPYNTYRRFGLPPTPICNPGRQSIRAALYPAGTDYLYFFAKGDGSHVFSADYESHLRKQRALKKR
ncbi:MAG: endolytic transglycosylase MltG [Elusimicrobia bacterium]|nr:endolytic transglycosylase MltG [Elusimicrobiota bacterium]